MAARNAKKSKRKVKAKAKVSTTQLPKGYESIGGFGKSWPNEDTEVGELLEGTIIEFDEVDVKRGKRTDTVQTLKLETVDGVFTIWESSGTRALFEYEEGTKVAIIFDGYGKAKRGQNAPKLFRIGVK